MVPQNEVFTFTGDELVLLTGIYALAREASLESSQAREYEKNGSNTSAKAHARKAKGLEESIAETIDAAPENVKKALQYLRDRLKARKEQSVT